jgi:hypothetical protein
MADVIDGLQIVCRAQRLREIVGRAGPVPPFVRIVELEVAVESGN